ncbi:MAG: hypothetical protein KGL53_07575, partial [Elusimicrobia bacterium]|nr:hypothetical protein [Elusimicrobiota bacterium]
MAAILASIEVGLLGGVPLAQGATREQIAQIEQELAQRRMHQQEVMHGPVPYANMRAALTVIRRSSEPAAVQRVYDYLPRIPVTGHADLMALYDEAVKGEKTVPFLSSGLGYDRQLRKFEPLERRLRGCTATPLQHDIALLLEKEIARFNHEGRVSKIPRTRRNFVRVALRQERVNSLIDAAGDGKNDEARHVLWEIVRGDEDGTYGQHAMEALGHIGNPQDLSQAIELMKKQPQLRLNLGYFGPMAIGPIVEAMKETG